MSNSIWKIRDVEPKKYPILALGDDGKYYVFNSPKLGTSGLGWKHRCHDYVKQYCYIDDLIAQADKAERAIWWLKEIVKNHRHTPITTAEMALKELDKANNG